ncbi:MAG: bifunctional phosphopantothenoylcysteine decarboxylase/phosphopantothenate--cysteine ligase CoaBC [Alphaproteobacteria bacterium]|nr:bifunctional phosphopantothenoylcysteine decarboxylase/phosphopantothenate--cysteine ligase CoaBC [Alphaproteobacteria bacterium]
MTASSGKRVLLIIGGGIAAYKVLELIRRLRECGHLVRAVMTRAAQEFITKLSVESLTGNRVYDDLFSPTEESGMGHIELSRDADLIVVAPATADLLAKMAHGLAGDLATTLLLATDKKILAAPAMNLRMWLHPATRRNMARLQEDGVIFTGPEAGEMACGEYGPGRMSEPLTILAAIEARLAEDTRLPLAPEFAGQSRVLAGRRVIVTSGPTHEPIDPVRYIANRSSGRQGHAIASAAAAAGADTVLISGPVTLADPAQVQTRHVETACEMLEAVEAALPADIFIGVAAVADWRVAAVTHQKIKKEKGREFSLTLTENPDILACVGKRLENRPALVVGFAAESEDILARAAAKLTQKNCDMILANDVGESSQVFGGQKNEVLVLTRKDQESWPPLDKEMVARRLILRLSALLAERGE